MLKKNWSGFNWLIIHNHDIFLGLISSSSTFMILKSSSRALRNGNLALCCFSADLTRRLHISAQSKIINLVIFLFVLCGPSLWSGNVKFTYTDIQGVTPHRGPSVIVLDLKTEMQWEEKARQKYKVHKTSSSIQQSAVFQTQQGKPWQSKFRQKFKVPTMQAGQIQEQNGQRTWEHL